MSTATQTNPPAGTVDDQEVADFADRLFGAFTDSFVTSMIDLGHRTGLFEAAAEGRATSEELASRAGLQERYVREWLGSVVTAGIMTYDAATGTYTLPPAHAVCLTGSTELNLAPLSQISGHLANFIEPVAEAFRRGGGVPYEAYRPEFTDVMDGLSRPLFDGVLADGIVPMAGLTDALTSGVRVADIGCGTGHSTNVLARAFPASELVGYDLSDEALGRGRAEAEAWGLTNVSFEVQDVARLSPDEPFRAVFAFDAIHDQADPAAVLDRVHAALTPGGTFVMFDIRASSHLEQNVGNPFAPMLYAISTLHCMTVSLANGGAGLGTVWGEELARQMLADAGFVDVEVHEVPEDPMDSVYVARKPG